MSSNSCIIVSVAHKHKLHAQVVSALQSQGHSVGEMKLPDESAGECSARAEIDKALADAKLIVVYIYPQIDSNICVKLLATEAEKRGIRIVCIWIEDVISSSIPMSVDGYSDAITPFVADITSVFSGDANPWCLPDGSAPSKRKIKKHTCG